MANSTLTLQSIVNLAQTHADMLPLSGVGGFANEPALSLCNDVLQELLSAPYGWKFNRQEMGLLVTAPNKQDYKFAGATAFTLGSTSSGAAIELSSNNAITVTAGVVTVKTIEAHRFSVNDVVYMTGNANANYNSTLTDNGTTASWSGGWTVTAVTSTSFSFAATAGQTNGDVTGASGITDFGWLESGTLVEMNNTQSPQNIHPVEAVSEIQPTGRSGPKPEHVCVIEDLGTGVIRIRFRYVPSTTIWGASLVYQKKAPLKVALTDTWSPFPDEYAYVLRQMFLARAYRYQNNPRSEVEQQKAQQAIMKALGQADREQSDIHVVPSESLLWSVFGDFYW